jgi:hypothetical protein
MVAFARLASYFPLLVQRKVTKANDTPCRLITSVLAHAGTAAELGLRPQTVLAA